MPKTTILEPLVGHMCPPFAAKRRLFWDLALGTCPWVVLGVICMVFMLGLGAILVTFVTYANQMPIDPSSYSPCLEKTSHGHTSTRIHKWCWRGREALWIWLSWSSLVIFMNSIYCYNYGFGFAARPSMLVLHMVYELLFFVFLFTYYNYYRNDSDTLSFTNTTPHFILEYWYIHEYPKVLSYVCDNTWVFNCEIGKAWPFVSRVAASSVSINSPWQHCVFGRMMPGIKK